MLMPSQIVELMSIVHPTGSTRNVAVTFNAMVNAMIGNVGSLHAAFQNVVRKALTSKITKREEYSANGAALMMIIMHLLLSH